MSKQLIMIIHPAVE